MGLNFVGDDVSGSYFYKSQNKPIELKGKYDYGISQKATGTIVLEEIINGKKTGTFEIYSVKNYPNLDILEGIRMDSETQIKSNFEVKKLQPELVNSTNSQTNSTSQKSPFQGGGGEASGGSSSQTTNYSISSQKTVPKSNSSLQSSFNNSQNQNPEENLYFKGKIGDLPIRMVLELDTKSQWKNLIKPKIHQELLTPKVIIFTKIKAQN